MVDDTLGGWETPGNTAGLHHHGPVMEGTCMDNSNCNSLRTMATFETMALSGPQTSMAVYLGLVVAGTFSEGDLLR